MAPSPHRVRPRLSGHRRRRHAAGECLPRQPERTFARPFARRARRQPGGRPDRRINRGQILYRIAELMEGRRDQFVAEVMAAEGLGGGLHPGGRRGHRPLGVVRRLGRQVRPGARKRRTPLPGRTSTSRSPSPPGWSASWPRSVVAARSGQPAGAGDRVGEHGRARPESAAAAGGQPGRGPRHLRRSRRRGQRHDRSQGGTGDPPRRAHGRERARRFGLARVP